MGLWKRTKEFFTYQHDEKRATTGQNYDFSKWFMPKNIFEGMASDTLADNEVIFSAISRLSNTMASLPLNLQEGHSPVSNNLAMLMKNSPNKNMTAFSFIREMEARRNSFGNAYAIKRYDDKFQIVGLEILENTKVNPMIDSDYGELYYEIQTVQGKYFAHNAEVVHLTHIYTSGYTGLSPLDVLRNTINYDKEIRKFSLSSIENGIKAGFVLSMATNLSDEKKKLTLDSFKNFYQSNGGGVIILETGSELKEIKKDFIDLKVFEVEKITKGRVANVFNIPAHFLGVSDNVSFSSMEQQSLEYVQNTILPIVRQYEQEFNRKLLTENERMRGQEFKFNLKGLLRADTATRGNFYFQGVRSGWFTPNEIRMWEDLPPIQNGDSLMVSGDLYTLDDILNRPEIKPTLKEVNK